MRACFATRDSPTQLIRSKIGEPSGISLSKIELCPGREASAKNDRIHIDYLNKSIKHQVGLNIRKKVGNLGFPESLLNS
jgi:hypothetical protein